MEMPVKNLVDSFSCLYCHEKGPFSLEDNFSATVQMYLFYKLAEDREGYNGNIH